MTRYIRCTCSPDCQIDGLGRCRSCNCMRCNGVSFTSTLDGQWPSDTWFRRALARKLRAEAAELELEAVNEVRAVQS